MTDDATSVKSPAAPPRRRRWIRCFVLLLFLGLSGPATCIFTHNHGPRSIERIAGDRPPRPAELRRVVLFVIDGLAPRHLAEARTPVLDELARNGWVAVTARTRESSTGPAMGTIVSGLPPATHRFGGCMYSASKRFEHETIFTLCGEEDLRCAFFTCKPKLATLVEHEVGAERYRASRTDPETLEEAARYFEEEDGDFALVHLCGPDGAGHNFGWGSRRQLDEINRIDGQIGRFLERLDAPPGSRPLAIQVVSDHGGSGRFHSAPRPENQSVVWMLSGDGVIAGVTDEDIALIDVAPTSLALLGLEAPRLWWGEASEAVVRSPAPREETQRSASPGRLESQTVR